jgi:glycerophosphoryl diester phosphodiesterase
VTSPLIIAHRTCPPYAAENSLEGIRVSFDQGADCVEIDLRLSLDQQPFILHDRLMTRTTGWPLPPELTLAFVIRRLRLKGSIERVLSLGAALDALPDAKLVAVDVKTPWSMPRLLREVQRRNMASRTLVWCGSARAVSYAASHSPGWEVAYYKDYADASSNRAFIDKAKRLGVQGVSLDWRATDAALVSYCHEAGLRFYAWHKDYELTPEKLSSGLDGIVTDHPAKARAAVASLP